MLITRKTRVSFKVFSFIPGQALHIKSSSIWRKLIFFLEHIGLFSLCSFLLNVAAGSKQLKTVCSPLYVTVCSRTKTNFWTIYDENLKFPAFLGEAEFVCKQRFVMFSKFSWSKAFLWAYFGCGEATVTHPTMAEVLLDAVGNQHNIPPARYAEQKGIQKLHQALSWLGIDEVAIGLLISEHWNEEENGKSRDWVMAWQFRRLFGPKREQKW
jgi:hypothetical protein